jgi:hypothetical protein
VHFIPLHPTDSPGAPSHLRFPSIFRNKSLSCVKGDSERCV